MGEHTSKSGGTSAKSSGNQNAERIADLRRQLAQPFEPSGRGYWGKQVDADLKRRSNIERQIKKLESESKKPNTKTVEKKEAEKKAAPTWQRAGEGWYIGKNGHEIRENYDTGGYDVVKVSGNSVKTVKHFAKLSQARKYNP